MRIENKSEVALRTGQGLLAALFVFAGVMKLVTPMDTLADQSGLPGGFMWFIGVVELLGGLGLILPGITGIKRGLAPLAASGLVIIMVGATAVTAGNGDVLPALFPLAVGIVAAWVAYVRRELLVGGRGASVLAAA